MNYKLSKSKYQSGLQCKKKLWLEINDREKASPLSKADERIFEQGTEVGIEARKSFPGGLLIEYDRSNPSSSVEKTKELIKDGAEVLFEGAFFYDDTLILADILTKNEDSTWDLIEVKSTTSVKPQHIPDLAIQKYVIEGTRYLLTAKKIGYFFDAKYHDLLTLKFGVLVLYAYYAQGKGVERQLPDSINKNIIGTVKRITKTHPSHNFLVIGIDKNYERIKKGIRSKTEYYMGNVNKVSGLLFKKGRKVGDLVFFEV